MKLHRRYLGALTYQANGFETLRLPRNYAYSAIEMLLIADIDRVVGVSAGTCRDSAPAQLVKMAEVVVNGKNTIKRLDLEFLHRRNQKMHGVRPYIYAHNLLGYAALDDDISKVYGRFDFELPRNGPWARQVDSLLDARPLSSLDLNITWGAPDDIMDDAYDPAAGGITVNSAKLHIWTLERVAAPVMNYATWKEFKLLSQTVPGAGVLTIDVPVNATYESITIKTHADNDQVDTIIPFGLANVNLIELYSGSEKFLSLPAGCLHASNRVDAQIEVPERIGSGAALNHAAQELLLEGYYALDFVQDGMLSEMLDTTRLGDLKLGLDCAVPGTQNVVDVYCSEIILPPAQPQGQAA